MKPSSPKIEYASPATAKTTPRLLSLDVFRGLVIFAMLIVNNIGDSSTTGYFWKHADWVPMSWGQAWKVWFTRIATGPPSQRLLTALEAESEQERQQILTRTELGNGFFTILTR